MSQEKIPTSLRSLAEQRTAQAKSDPSISVLGRPRVFSEKPGLIKVYLERNIRPINWETVEEYKQAMIRGDQFPAVDVSVEAGEIVLRHGYHRTLAAQAAVKECPDLADFQLELREFRGNSLDAIFLMLNSQESLPLDPISRAEGYLQAYKQLQSYAKVGARVGKSGEHVAKQLLLVEVEESVKNLVRGEKIKASTVIELIQEEKQGGRNHVDVAMEMVSNAEAAGKTTATPKHRSPAAPANAAPKLKMKEVKRTLSSLGGISETLRSALASHSITEEGLSGGEQAEVMVPVELPAAKLAELLALLDMQSAASSSDAGQDSTAADNEEQADMFAESASEA